MLVIQTTGQQNIPITISIYNTFLQRLRGLMFRLYPLTTTGVLLTPCNSIHTCFMFFPIDVIFMNRDNEVIQVKKQVKPWTFILPIKHAVTTLELPNGTITQYNIQIGDYIHFFS